MPRRLLQLFAGCTILGTGVALLLAPALGSDGFSSLVNGISLTTGLPFVVANLLVSIGFLAVAMLGGVGFTVSLLIAELSLSGADMELAKGAVLVASMVASLLAAVLLLRRSKARSAG